MLPQLLARLHDVGAHAVKSRKEVAVAGAVAMALLASGAFGARQLRADTTTPAATATPSASALPASNAGPKNIVQVKNFTDGAVRIDGRVQLGRVPGSGVGAVNIASAFSSCTDCTTLAVALQINVFNRNATVITPQNAAVAVNGGCTRCDTVAYAVQYNIGVDDPTQVPPRVDQMVAQMKQELAQASAGNTTLGAAEADINAVIGQYQDLTGYLTTRRDEAVAPAASPASPAPANSSPVAPAASPSPSPSDSPSPAETPSPSPNPAPASPSPSTTTSAQPGRLAD